MWPPLNGRAKVQDRCLAGGLAGLGLLPRSCGFGEQWGAETYRFRPPYPVFTLPPPFRAFGSFTPTSVRRSFLNSQVSSTRSQKPPTGKAVLPYGGFREEAPHEEGNDRVNLGWEDSPRGLWRSLGKRVGFTPSGVQIPYPPRRQQGGVHRFGAPRPLLVFFSAVACPSGQRSTPRKRVWG